MTGMILEKILEAKRHRVDEAKRATNIDELTARAQTVRANAYSNRMRKVLSNQTRTNIIAEFKKASPSKGTIKKAADPAMVALAYTNGGAAAISVLTEEDFFKGSLDDLRAVRKAVDLPILRKDFIFDEFQVYEAAEAGADAVLLIAAMLDYKALEKLYSLAAELGLDSLVEVHTSEEMMIASKLGTRLIGVNNRDLNSFNVSLDVSREMIKQVPNDALMISESGLKTRDDLIELRNLGYSGFLIGEVLMRSGDPEKELRKLATNNTNDTN